VPLWVLAGCMPRITLSRMTCVTFVRLPHAVVAVIPTPTLLLSTFVLCVSVARIILVRLALMSMVIMVVPIMVRLKAMPPARNRHTDD